MKTNYNQYQFSKKEWIWHSLESSFLCLVINYLFYRSWIAFFFLFPIPLFYLKNKKKQLIKQRKNQLNYQFRDALSALNAALRAGYSLENAFTEACRDLKKIYGKEEDLVKEFTYIEHQLHLQVPLEKLLHDFAGRSGVEDVANFSVILATAKRTGGNVITILQKSIRILEDKIDVKKEIDAALAAKKLEHTIMSCMPFGILCYMQITSPGFLEVLYGNVFGVFIMTACLGIYLLAYWMGRKIVDIEV